MLAFVIVGLVGLRLHAAPQARQAWAERLEALADRLPMPLQVLRLQMRPPDAVLAMPVQGVRPGRVADTWGAPRDGGARRHQGQDIFARRGTPVVAAAGGYVLRVAEHGRGGKVVWVLGAGGRRYYYAHLDAHAPGLSAGDRVEPGLVLGAVGTTGNARGTPPHLHFGVYGPGGAIDPLPLLQAGEAVFADPSGAEGA